MRLDVPDTGGRYYVLQFVDAWTNNFAYVGQRATGTGAGSFLLVPPGGSVPDNGIPVIRFPTKVEAEPRQRYLLRAGAARSGLWGNHGYEAAYAMVYQDADGNQLNGGSRYQLRFGQTPPVGAFWSVTMYDTPNFFLVANPIGRYSIGDRTPGLNIADDGSLTIFMQRDEPQSPEQRAN